MRCAATCLSAALAIAAGGCAATRLAGAPKERSEISAGGGRFTIEYARGDEEAARMVAKAIAAAAPKLARWGTLREPVRIVVLPDHRLFEDVVGRSGWEWLRAWAQYDTVHLESPAAWMPVPASQGELDEVVLHELTHSVMYQLSSSRTSWRRKEIPLWFLEGMASYTSNQCYRWKALTDLTAYLRDHPGHNPVLEAEALYADQQKDLVYGASDRAFTFLVERYGDEKVRALLAAMRADQTFPKAFAEAFGVSPADFVEDFTRYVRYRGYEHARPARRPPPPPAAPPAPR